MKAFDTPIKRMMKFSYQDALAELGVRKEKWLMRIAFASAGDLTGAVTDQLATEGEHSATTTGR